jgi:hypothetical protein
MKISRDDIATLRAILKGRDPAELPEFDRSRLVALGLIEERDGAWVLSPRGDDLVATQLGLQQQ